MRASSLLSLLALIGCNGSGKDSETTTTSTMDSEFTGDSEETTTTTACPVILLDATELQFVDVPLNQSGQQSLLVTNDCAGKRALDVTVSIDPVSKVYEIDVGILSLEPSQSQTITITYTPDDAIGDRATLLLSSNDSSRPVATVPLDSSVRADDDADGFNGAQYGGDDCNDADASIYPGAPDTPYDGVDSDCDGTSDNDADKDGYDDLAHGGADCDDAVATTNPGEAEIWYDGVDSNCDGANDYDQDADGHEVVSHGGDDCDDVSATTYPGAVDNFYDGVDSNCDGANDYDQDLDGVDSPQDCNDLDGAIKPGATDTWYDGIDSDCDGANDNDQDADGYEVSVDCDDLNATINPGIAETWYDGVDSNCDLANDNDQDADGFEVTVDCDDTVATTYPGASDTWYDGVDSNCDGANDDDQDADGVTIATDCDDTDESIYPGATEIWYDGVDSDCDGANDFDQDGDGVLGVPGGGSDCNDVNPTITGAALESENGIDDDCDGLIDEDFVAAGDIVVTEIMSDPVVVSDVYGEYFEVYNTSSLTRDLNGWTIFSDDGNSILITSSVPIAPGGYAVLGADGTTSRNGGVTLNYAYNRTNFSLSSSDTFFLESPSGSIISEMNYDTNWAMVAGYALELDWLHYDAASMADSQYWCSSTQKLSGGDYGSPGGPGEGCTAFDHDGDGVSVDDGDCDDKDGNIGPSNTDVPDGVDNDCDGVTDNYVIKTTNTPYVTGAAADSLSYRYSVAYGDIDNDGLDDLLVGGINGASGSGKIYLLEAADYSTWAGPVSGYAKATVTGTTASNYLAAVDTSFNDNTGDGFNDLAVAGCDSYSAANAPNWVLYEGPVTGAVTPASAILSFSGAGVYTSPSRIETSLDFDADGVGEIVYGEASVSRFWVVNSSGLSGALTTADADSIISSGVTDALGNVYAGADINADGYDDLVVGATWADSYAGALYVIEGQDLLGKSTTAEALYSLKVTGVAAGNYLTLGAHPVLSDMDGDGKLDLAVGSPLKTGAFFFSDLNGMSGIVSASTADTSIAGDGGYFGYALDSYDLDGDGADELFVGSPDGSYHTGSDYGHLYVFSDLGSYSSLTTSDALYDLSTPYATDNFGFEVIVRDIGNDGTIEAIVGSPGDDGSSTYNGRFWIPSF